jgi:hypothetical protein
MAGVVENEIHACGESMRHVPQKVNVALISKEDSPIDQLSGVRKLSKAMGVVFQVILSGIR